MRRGVVFAAYACAAALALAGCDPVATSAAGPGAGGASSPGSAGSASAVALESTGLRERLDGEGHRIDALERALLARDQRIRELDEALVSLSERNAKELSSIRGAMDEAIGRLGKENVALRTELAQARRTVEALRAASPLPNLAADVPRIEGRVLSLDRTPDGAALVLLDLGEKQGIRRDYELTVVRGGRPLAKLVVERVEAQFSSGRVVFSKDGETIQPGDVATTRP